MLDIFKTRIRRMWTRTRRMRGTWRTRPIRRTWRICHSADTDGRIFNSSGKKLFILVNNQRYTVIVISLD